MGTENNSEWLDPISAAQTEPPKSAYEFPLWGPLLIALSLTAWIGVVGIVRLMMLLSVPD